MAWRLDLLVHNLEMRIRKLSIAGNCLPAIRVLDQLASRHAGRLAAKLFPPTSDLSGDIFR